MYVEVNGKQAFFATGSGAIDVQQSSVVFIHGAGMDHSIWVLPSRHFARHKYNVIAVDLPGHGKSEGDPLPSVESNADWISALISALNIERSAIVGHSMGSLIALAMAASHPEQCSSLTLLGTSVPMQVTDQLLSAARDNSHDAIDMANTWSHSRFGQIGGNDVPGMWMTGGGQRLLERAGEDVFFTDLNCCNEFTDGLPLAERVSCPTLVIIGAQDAMTAPVNARKVAETIKQSRTLTLEKCGHAMLSERPDAVLDALITIV
jgi:pimeloyl-ACP methyl ester carboxylesterase|tara:strand:+ start:391 stop:1179 length:789 start_codon:yes stop_codon:yes gene_type:complete